MVNGVGKPLHGAAAQSMASYADILTYNYTGDWTNCGGTCPDTPAPTAPSQAPTPANPCTARLLPTRARARRTLYIIILYIIYIYVYVYRFS